MKVIAPPISFEQVRSQALRSMPGEPRVVVISEDAQTSDIVTRVRYVLQHYGHQVNAWAHLLKASTPGATLARVFDFIQFAVVYQLDPTGLQAALSPQAALMRGRGDCKTYAILGASLLDALGFEVRLRFVQYRKPDLEHVYLIVRQGGRDLAFDPCLKRLGQEQPYTRKADYSVTRLVQIAGVGQSQPMAQSAPPLYTPPSLQEYLRARERRYAALSGLSDPIADASIGLAFLGPLVAKVSAGFGKAKAFIAANPEAKGMIDDSLKSIPLVGDLLNKIFGKCGWFAGWDHESRAQLQRVNANKRYIGEEEIVGPDAECNWRTTLPQDRVALELATENKAMQVQVYQRLGVEGVVVLLQKTYQRYDDYMNRRDPYKNHGGVVNGYLRDLREHYLNEWQKQNRGQRGSFTIEQWLYNDALKITAQYDLETIFSPGQSPSQGSSWAELEQAVKGKLQPPGGGAGDNTAALAAMGVLLLLAN